MALLRGTALPWSPNEHLGRDSAELFSTAHILVVNQIIFLDSWLLLAEILPLISRESFWS